MYRGFSTSNSSVVKYHSYYKVKFACYYWSYQAHCLLFGDIAGSFGIVGSCQDLERSSYSTNPNH